MSHLILLFISFSSTLFHIYEMKDKLEYKMCESHIITPLLLFPSILFLSYHVKHRVIHLVEYSLRKKKI